MASKQTTAQALASAVAAALFTNLALAATPTAVWDCAVAGQELNTTQEGLTINSGAGNSFVNGKLVIASSGYYSGGNIDISSLGVSNVSVLVKYSNFAGFTGHSYFPVFMCVRDSDSHELGLLASDGSTTFSWYWYDTSASGTPDQHRTGSPAFVPAAGYALFSYDAATGLRLCSGTALSNLTTEEKGEYKFPGQTLTKLGLGGAPGYQWSDGWPSLVIEKVALFTGDYLAASDVADYEFPSETGMINSDVTVSEINTAFGENSEITLRLANGVTVTGDTTFNASTVHFVCEGSFNMTPPANNEATFDFSNVTGSPVIIYTGAFPSANGTTFTANYIPTFVNDSARWTGTIWIKNANAVNFAPNDFGNASSTVRLSGVSGHFANGTVSCNPAIELVNDTYSYGLNVNNGYSRDANNPNRRITINTLKGSGAFWTGNNANTVLFNVLDWSGYTGSIQLVNKIVVFGSTVPSVSEFNTSGAIYVGSGATVTLPTQWRADGGIHVYGTLESDSMDKIRTADTANNIPATRIVTYDTGTFIVKGAGGERQFNVDYSQVTGTGTLKFEGSDWFTLPSNNSISTNLTLCPARTNGLVIPPGGITVGSITGSGNLRSDLEAAQGGTATMRDFTIVQTKDTTWSGIFSNGDRVGTVYVKPGENAGTLTLSGAQTASNNLVVESGAAVNLTGTWVGATTVAGTLGGTGTLTGDLSLSDGATLKVGDLANPLKVTGDFSAASGTINIDLPAGTPTGTGSKFLDVNGTRSLGANTKFNITIGGVPCKMQVTAVDGGLKVVPYGFMFKLR